MSTVDVDLALVRRFYAVCQRYDTRPSVARRNTLPMLIRYLTSNEREVRQCAVESLCLLAQHPQSAQLLASNDTLASSVATLLQRTQLDDPELHDAAQRLRRLLRPSRHHATAGSDSGVSSSSSLPSSCSDVYDDDDVDGAHGSDDVDDDKVISSSNDKVTTAHRRHAAAATTRPRRQLYDTPHKKTRPQPPSSLSSSLSSSLPPPTTTTTATGSPDHHSNSRYRRQQRRAHASSGQLPPPPPRLVTLEVPAINARADLTDVEAVLQRTRGVVSYTIVASAHQLKVFVSPQMDVAVLQDALHAVGYASLVVSVERRVLADEAYATTSTTTATASSSSHAYEQSPSLYATRYRAGGGGGGYFDAQPSRPTYGQKARTFASSLVSALTVYGGGGGGGGAQSQSLADRVQRQQQASNAPRSATAERLAKAFARWW